MRIKRFEFSAQMLVDLLKKGKKGFTYEIANALPDDAEIVRISTDIDAAAVSVVSVFVTSSQFEDLSPGKILPAEHFIVIRYFGEDH